MYQRPYNPAEFNALMAQAKIRAAQARREAANAWGTKLWQWLWRSMRGMNPRASMTRNTQERSTSTCPT